ncbi:MAG: hypothetical protein GWN99_04180, partial [Gemmatimonadetes bacterium]|nr:hypothetical protein [Gemmatimonadota bacterium]NIS00264.1 hypothetical protein [Gemmatimonadota bacterium]
MLEGVLQVIESGADPEQGQRLKALARAVLTRTPTDFFRGRTDGEVFELVSSTFELLESTAPDGIGVRVAQRPGYG